jgi:hypothetical protein
MYGTIPMVVVEATAMAALVPTTHRLLALMAMVVAEGPGLMEMCLITVVQLIMVQALVLVDRLVMEPPPEATVLGELVGLRSLRIMANRLVIISLA